MEQLKKIVEAMALIEKYDIIEKHGLFNSAHESFAVALEEWEEAKEEIDWAKKELDEVWRGTREDNEQEVICRFKTAYNHAICAAAECAQFAAVCLKAIKSLDENKEIG